jgi:hypothetical protein
MSILQALPALTQTQKNHAPYLQKRRVIKRPSLLSRTSSKPTRENWDQGEQDKKTADPGSVNLESMYFRGFRSRPLLHAEEELRLAIRLYEGTTHLRALLQQAVDISKKLQPQQEVEPVHQRLQKFLDLKGYSPPVIEEILQSVLTLQSLAASKGKEGRKTCQQAEELHLSIQTVRMEIEEPKDELVVG